MARIRFTPNPMTELQGFKESVEGVRPAFQPATQAEAEARAQPLTSAFLARRAVLEPRAARAAFVPFAARGLGVSKLAERGVKRRVEAFRGETESERLRIINQARADIQREREAQERLQLQREANEAQKEANRPRGLFAELFG